MQNQLKQHFKTNIKQNHENVTSCKILLVPDAASNNTLLLWQEIKITN